MKPNVPKTDLPRKMFATVGNIGIAGDRLVNRQANQIQSQVATGGGGGGGGGIPAGYGPQTLDICVNGAAGHIVVLAQPPVEG